MTKRSFALYTSFGLSLYAAFAACNNSSSSTPAPSYCGRYHQQSSLCSDSCDVVISDPSNGDDCTCGCQPGIGGTPACDPATHKCIPLSHSKAVCSACVSDDECAAGLTCGADTHACLKACTTSGDCAAPSTCSPQGNCACAPTDAGPDTASDGSPGTTVIPPHDTADVQVKTFGGGMSFSFLLQALATKLTPGSGLTRTRHSFQSGSVVVYVDIYSGGPDVRTNVSLGGSVSAATGATTLGTAMADDMYDYFLFKSGTTPFVMAGAPLHISWDGSADIPAGAGDVFQPAPVTVTSPVPPTATTPIDINKTVPLHAAFTGTSKGTLTLNIFGGDGLSAIVSTVDASMVTSWDIGVDALALLGEGPNGAFFITQQSAMDVTAGTRTVTVSSIVSPKAADGTTDWTTVTANVHH